MKPNWIIDLAKTASLRKVATQMDDEARDLIFENLSDPQDFVDAVYDGDMSYFFQDNPGAADALLEWLKEEWGSGKAPMSEEQEVNLLQMAQAKGWLKDEDEEALADGSPEAPK